MSGKVFLSPAGHYFVLTSNSITCCHNWFCTDQPFEGPTWQCISPQPMLRLLASSSKAPLSPWRGHLRACSPRGQRTSRPGADRSMPSPSIPRADRSETHILPSMTPRTSTCGCDHPLPLVSPPSLFHSFFLTPAPKDHLPK